MSTAPAEASPSPAPSSSNACIWDVQDILAERTSVTGENEYLVVWKPSWIPVSNMADGPVMHRYESIPKWTYSSAQGSMRLKLPVEPGTVLAEDCAAIVAAADAKNAASKASNRRSTAGIGEQKRPLTDEQ
jgi:hypothetical protein